MKHTAKKQSCEIDYYVWLVCDDHFTWRCLTLSNQEGALRIPRSEEESHGFVSRNVLKEPPAAQTHNFASRFELTTSLPSGTQHALLWDGVELEWYGVEISIVMFPVWWHTLQSPLWSLQQSCMECSPAGPLWETLPNTTLDRSWVSKETETIPWPSLHICDASQQSNTHCRKALSLSPHWQKRPCNVNNDCMKWTASHSGKCIFLHISWSSLRVCCTTK